MDGYVEAIVKKLLEWCSDREFRKFLRAKTLSWLDKASGPSDEVARIDEASYQELREAYLSDPGDDSSFAERHQLVDEKWLTERARAEGWKQDQNLNLSGKGDSEKQSLEAKCVRLALLHYLCTGDANLFPDGDPMPFQLALSRLGADQADLLIGIATAFGDVVDAFQQQGTVQPPDLKERPGPRSHHEPTTRSVKMNKDDVKQILHQKVKNGERYSSNRKLADEIGCGPAVVNRAINSDPALKEWSTKLPAPSIGIPTYPNSRFDEMASGEAKRGLDDDEADAVLERLKRDMSESDFKELQQRDPHELRELLNIYDDRRDEFEQAYRRKQASRNAKSEG
ncbi:MAG: hypothetical protein KDB23_25915 [Planctomycetales bacterium]|nr:hypothetical protein [Planctomycetales bacterium]